MSSFLVSSETMIRVVSVMIGDQSCEWADKIGRDLYSLNCKALEARYGEPVDVPEFHYSPRNYTLLQQYKTCCCLHYQCEEGDVPEMSLYSQLDHVINSLAHRIVSELPEFQQLPWDA